MTENTNKARPTHTIDKVTGEGDTAKWIKVGVAFAHKDQKGLALMFDGIPVEGRIAVRKNRPGDATAAGHPQKPSRLRRGRDSLTMSDPGASSWTRIRCTA